MPKKRLPAIVDRAVWDKVTKERAGIKCDSVVKKALKYIGGNQEDMMPAEVWEVQGRSRRNDREKGKAGAEKQGEIGDTLGDIRGIRRRDRNVNALARPNGLRENAETV